MVGFRLDGRLPEGATATDLVLTVVEMLRAHGVVGKFVEFFGAGLDELPVADRATIANMAPEYGATCGIFPIDAETLRYLELSGRDADQIALVEAYARAQGMFREPGAVSAARYSEVLELDMGTVRPCIAGPRRPQDRIPLDDAKLTVRAAIADARGGGDGGRAAIELGLRALRARGRGGRHRRDHVVHQHVQPRRHAGGGPARRARPRPRP